MVTLQSINDYRNNNAFSQTDLKNLLKGSYKKYKPSLAQTVGSYLDVALLTPHLKDDLYYVVDVSRPTDKIVELCESFYKWVSVDYQFSEQVIETDLEKYKGLIEDWIETVDYYSNRPNTRVEKFIKEAKEWWAVLVQKGDRQIITSMEELETELILINLQGDLRWDWISKGEFQKDFYWEEQGVACKGLGDICFDEVYIDIKYTTCANPREWMKVCANLNYPFQMAFYKSGLGFKKGYWLVIHKDWHELIEVEDIMYQTGKWGYDKKQTIRIGKVEFDTWIHTPGYIDGINLVKGLPLTNFNQLYLSYL